MKHSLLLLSFAFSASVFAQSTVNISSSAYNAAKTAGTLDINKNYKFTDGGVTPGAVHYLGDLRTPTPSSICSCMIPLDSTFSIVPFYWGATAPDFRNDDASTTSISIPFSFNLYGTLYDSLFINNNGNVSFSSSYSTFTATPFPDSLYRMIAPFWGDVDTRDSASGLVYYQITPTHMIVKWENVGYFPMMSDKLNTFQLILTDGTDALLPAGTNVGFCYGDMQWTTGSASGGFGGFGGFPATVGVNQGNGTDYFQVGTFDNAGTAFDGPYGAADQVDWLDNQGMYFDVATIGNIPPVIISNNICDTIDVFTGDTLRTVNYDIVNFTIGGATPEIAQMVNTTITCSEPSALTVNQTMNTPTYQQFDCSFSAIGLAPGIYTVTVSATDNGVPAKTSTRNIIIRTNYDASVATGITESILENSLSIYPNPSSGNITLKHGFDLNLSPTVSIVDVVGKVVTKTNLTSATQSIDINTLPQGIYFATVSSKNGISKTMKIVRK